MIIKDYDLHRLIDSFRQVLSQNKKPIGFLLGAGCPLAIQIKVSDGCTEPLIPDVKGLTDFVVDKLREDTGEKDSLIDKILKILNEDGVSDPNIEDILSLVRALKSVAGCGNVRGLNKGELVAIDRDICQVISKIVNQELPNRGTPYHDLAIWVRSIPRDKPVHVFTTNYDLLMEQALEEEACPYFDGFIGAKKAFFDIGIVEDEESLPPRWGRLWKMHGSINWRLNGSKVIRSFDSNTDQHYLIYPSHIKYDKSRKMPYLAMLDRLKDFIMKPSSSLVISGYSFSDYHINNIILQALTSNPTAICYAFLFGNLSENYAKAIECAEAVPNLSLIAFDKGVIGRSHYTWAANEEKIDELQTIIKRNGGSEGGNHSYDLLLGDFNSMGTFLRELTGIKENKGEIDDQ